MPAYREIGGDPQGSRAVEILIIFILSLATCMDGIIYGWTSPSIPILISEEFRTASHQNITLEDTSDMVIVSDVSTVVSAFAFASVADACGRKYLLMAIAVPHFLVWLIIILSDSLYMFYLSRIVYGIAEGGLFIVLPSYLGEITTPHVRGTWGNVPSISYYLGHFLINAVGGSTSIKRTAIIFIGFPIFYLAAICFVPESPYYLTKKSNAEGARRSLQILRRKQDVDEELKQITSNTMVQEKESGSWADLLLNRTHRRAFLAVCFANAAQQFSGVEIYTSFAAFFFQHAETNMSYTKAATAYTFLLAVTNAASSTIHESLGRKTSLLISSAGCAFFMLAMSAYFYLKEFTTVNVLTINWFPLLTMSLIVVMFSLGLGNLPALIDGEVFSASIKAKGLCAGQMMMCLYTAVAAKIFQIFTEDFGMFAAPLFFGLCCVLSALLVSRIVPETRGKTLEEIQRSMKEK